LLQGYAVLARVFDHLKEFVGEIVLAEFDAFGGEDGKQLVARIRVFDGLGQINGRVQHPGFGVAHRYERDEFGVAIEILDRFGDPHGAGQEAVSVCLFFCQILVHV
jgi:hypothetical protein